MCARRRSLTCAQVGNPDVWSCTISEDDVVDQSGFADPYRPDCGIAVANAVDALERVGVHCRQVARRQSNHSLEHAPTNRLERARSALSSAESVAHREQSSGKNQAELTILWREVAVAAGHGESVGVPDSRCNKNPDGKIEIPDHSLYGRCLLEVL